MSEPGRWSGRLRLRPELLLCYGLPIPAAGGDAARAVWLGEHHGPGDAVRARKHLDELAVVLESHRDRHLRIALLELVAHRLVARASGVRPSGVGTERQGQRQQARAEHTEHGGSGFLWGEGPYHRSLLQLADRSGSAATAALRRSSRSARKTKARAEPVTTVTNHSKFIRRDG